MLAQCTPACRSPRSLSRPASWSIAALFDELGLDVIAQAAVIPLTRPRQVGHRQLQVMDPRQRGSLLDVHSPSNTRLPSLREAQLARTEERIVAAATGLFLADGYVATTLDALAGRAQVGARTVYVRFGSKAALFKRVVDVAIVGDAEPVDVLGRSMCWAATGCRPR
jgi:Bacterial regulatory proteins, tetR family